MVKVIFKNLKKSDLIRNIVESKVDKTIEKFNRGRTISATVIVSREHSPEHAGVDWFSVKLLLQLQSGKPVVLEKSAESMYQALAIVSDRALEILHRSIEKERIVIRHERRRWKLRHKYMDASPWHEEVA